MKIVSLQSINSGICIEIASNFPRSYFSVESIEIVRWENERVFSSNNVLNPAGYYYKVTTSDGHIRMLPEQAYIAEWVEVQDDNNR